mmetsp:Transcript_10175/g.22029  ORF Transcript_10175/g.22029 Transcript_10175/m.22029 type:complete len:221 (-) Transcript_10175:142-804(-)
MFRYIVEQCYGRGRRHGRDLCQPRIFGIESLLLRRHVVRCRLLLHRILSRRYQRGMSRRTILLRRRSLFVRWKQQRRTIPRSTTSRPIPSILHIFQILRNVFGGCRKSMLATLSRRRRLLRRTELLRGGHVLSVSGQYRRRSLFLRERFLRRRVPMSTSVSERIRCAVSGWDEVLCEYSVQCEREIGGRVRRRGYFEVRVARSVVEVDTGIQTGVGRRAI